MKRLITLFIALALVGIVHAEEKTLQGTVIDQDGNPIEGANVVLTRQYYDEIIEIHGFIVYETQKLITFDMIVDFDADREKVKSRILKEIKQKHPQYTYQVIDDYDVSD